MILSLLAFDDAEKNTRDPAVVLGMMIAVIVVMIIEETIAIGIGIGIMIEIENEIEIPDIVVLIVVIILLVVITNAVTLVIVPHLLGTEGDEMIPAAPLTANVSRWTEAILLLQASTARRDEVLYHKVPNDGIPFPPRNPLRIKNKH